MMCAPSPDLQVTAQLLHEAFAIPAFMGERSGFARVARLHVPFYWRLFPLFLVSAWKLDDRVSPP